MVEYESPVLTVDGILFERNKVLLARRTHTPFRGYWVLPGGHVEYGERVEDAVKREMREELGTSITIKKLFGVYSEPTRDPRHHAVTIVYLIRKKTRNAQAQLRDFGIKFFLPPQAPLPYRL